MRLKSGVGARGKVDPKEFASAVQTALRNEKRRLPACMGEGSTLRGTRAAYWGGGITAGCRGFFQSRGGDAESRICHHFAPLGNPGG